MKITRTITIDVTTTMTCCRDGVETYSPSPQDFHKTLTVTKDNFPESLTLWRDRITQSYENYLWDKAKDECEKVGTRRLCSFTADWSRTTVEEFIIPTIPTKRLITAVELPPTKRKVTAKRLPKPTPKEEIPKKEEKPKPKELKPEKMPMPTYISEHITILEIEKERKTNKETKTNIQKIIDELKSRYRPP